MIVIINIHLHVLLHVLHVLFPFSITCTVCIDFLVELRINDFLLFLLCRFGFIKMKLMNYVVS